MKKNVINCLCGLLLIAAIATITIAAIKSMPDCDTGHESTASGPVVSISGNRFRIWSSDNLLPTDLTFTEAQRAQIREAMLSGRSVHVIYTGTRLVDMR